jgi:PAS domain S-box-containing protein
MSIYSVPQLISSIIVLFVGIFVVLKNRKSMTNITFSLECLSVFLWLFGYAMMSSTRDEAFALWCARFVYTGVVFIPTFFYHFIVSFLHRERKRKKTLVFAYLNGIAFCILLISTDKLVAGVYHYYWGYHTKIDPVGASAFYLMLLVIFSLGLKDLILVRKATQQGTQERNRSNYVFVAYIIALAALRDVLPDYGIESYPFGFIFIVMWIALFAYGIFKHQLMDITVVIKKTFSYSLILLFLIIVPCFAALKLTEIYLPQSFYYPVLTCLFVLVGFVYPKIKVQAERNLENILFKGMFDYRETLDRLSKKMATLQNLEELLSNTTATIAKAMDTSALGAYLVTDDHQYELKSFYGNYNGKHSKIDGSSALVQHMQNSDEIIKNNRMDRNSNSDNSSIDRELDELGAYVGIPIKFEHELRGFIVIAEKESAGDYTKEELKVLSTMANQLAVAVENSLKYEEIRELNINLENKVDERTNELKQTNEQLQGDILRRKEAEEKLRYSKHLLERTLHSLRDAVFLLDADTVEIVDCNPAASEIFGYSHDEMLGQTTTMLHVDRAALEAFRGHLYAAIEEKGFLHKLEFSMKRKDGTVFSTEHSVTPLVDEQGKRTGWVSVVSDITEKQKLEEELLKAQRLESIGTLAGGIAHDYNNILTGILGNIALAQIYTEPHDRVFDLLTEAEKASLRAKDLTRKLLTFSRGGAPMRKRASIAGILRDAVDLALSGSQVTNEYSLPEDLWPVEVDEAQIRQAIHNIAINAKEAMPEGGTITVSADNVTLAAEDMLPLADGKYIKISIKDQGMGIPREHFERIFDPYFTTKELGNQKGLGLGLSICHSIIKRHHGHINVESAPETGTTFSIYLPACEPESPQKTTEEQTPAVGKGKVLVMDDEEIVRYVAGEMLAHLGYEVEFAKNGDEAIELNKKAKESGEPFAAIIMDLTIPGGMGGKETIKKMLEIDPGFKAIVSSGYSNDPVMTDFKTYGFSGVITKPYKIEELRKALHRVINEG